MLDDGAAQLGSRKLVTVVELPDVKRQQAHRLRVRRQRADQHVFGIVDQRGQRLARQPETDEAARRHRHHHVAGFRARLQHGLARAELDIAAALRGTGVAARDDRQHQVVGAVEQFARSCDLEIAARPGSDAEPGQFAHIRFGMKRAVVERLRIELDDHPPDLLAKDRQAIALAKMRGRESKPCDIARLHCHRLALIAAEVAAHIRLICGGAHRSMGAMQRSCKREPFAGSADASI